jgi:hypothetical protein
MCLIKTLTSPPSYGIQTKDYMYFVYILLCIAGAKVLLKVTQISIFWYSRNKITTNNYASITASYHVWSLIYSFSSWSYVNVTFKFNLKWMWIVGTGFPYIKVSLNAIVSLSYCIYIYFSFLTTQSDLYILLFFHNLILHYLFTLYQISFYLIFLAIALKFNFKVCGLYYVVYTFFLDK